MTIQVGHLLDLRWHTLFGNASLLSDVVLGTNQNEYFFGMSPGALPVIMFSRALLLTEGEYRVDVVRAANGFTGGAVMNKAALRQGSSAVAVDAFSGVTPDGAITVIEAGLVDTGSGLGASVQQNVTSASPTSKVFTGDVLLRVTRLGTGAWDMQITVEVAEIALP